MRDVNRVDPILDRLKALWKRKPDLRPGQLIPNVLQDPMPYYIEDEGLIDILGKIYNQKTYNQGVQ